MRRRTFVAMAATGGTFLLAPVRGYAQANAGTATPTAEEGDVTGSRPQTGYAPVNGVEMYYEIHGSGEPLVLLHGAFGAIDLWGPILTTLAENRQVIAVELQGHGHTADIDRPFSYEQFADDTAAFAYEPYPSLTAPWVNLPLLASLLLLHAPIAVAP